MTEPRHVGTPDPTSPRVRDAEGNVIQRDVVTTEDVPQSGGAPVKGTGGLPKSAADAPSERKVRGT